MKVEIKLSAIEVESLAIVSAMMLQRPYPNGASTTEEKQNAMKRLEAIVKRCEQSQESHLSESQKFYWMLPAPTK